MSWLHRYTDPDHPRLRLICFPHAGGTADFYRPWSGLLPPQVELLAVQYPSRRERFTEAPVLEMTQLAEALADALAPLTDRPYALFGHSMGAAVAYETALRLRSSHRAPARLFVSGREAPRHAHGGAVHRRDDNGVLAELRRLGGTAPELLADPEMSALLLRPVRADYQLIETYRPSRRGAIDVPVTAFVGDADPDAPITQVADWAESTDAGFDLQVFPGDHFFLVPRRSEVVDHVIRRLDAVVGWPALP